jgi:hypothetical protein
MRRAMNAVGMSNHLTRGPTMSPLVIGCLALLAVIAIGVLIRR